MKQIEGVELKSVPTFPNHCNHKPEEFICSFKITKIKNEKLVMEWHDLYVFLNSNKQQEICLRYGKEGADYRSSGLLIDFLCYHGSFAPDEPYKTAIKLLKQGKITWEKPL